MPRRVLHESRVLITGASSGIGSCLALQLAPHHARLLLTARRADRLADLSARISRSGAVAQALPGDITDPDHRQALAAWIGRHWGALDVLINNAGIGALGPFATADPERLRRVMEVNFFAAAELTRVCIPLLRVGRRPAIVHVGSVLAYVAVPHKSEYCASKFALRGWGDALRTELAPEGIDVLAVHPSTTSTEFFDRTLGRIRPLGRRQRSMSPDRVARATLAALAAGRPEIILSPGGRALVWAGRLAPSLVRRLVRRFGPGTSDSQSPPIDGPGPSESHRL